MVFREGNHESLDIPAEVYRAPVRRWHWLGDSAAGFQDPQPQVTHTLVESREKIESRSWMRKR